jgi:transcriptional/translational regulatory protein YebC/TACO1
VNVSNEKKELLNDFFDALDDDDDVQNFFTNIK